MSIHILLIPFGLYGLVFIVDQRWANKINKLGKVDDRILILQLDPGAKNQTRTKQKFGSRKTVFKLELGSRLN